MSLSGAIWGREWYPRMGGVLNGAQIGSCGLSYVCARARAYVGVCTRRDRGAASNVRSMT